MRIEARTAVPTLSNVALFAVGAALLAAALAACGFIADKDRIVVAVMDGKDITRGDLTKLIHDMPDEERPLIQNKGDLLRALNRHIDDRIKQALAVELSAAGKISVSRDTARAVYLQAHPEFAAAFRVQDPSQLGMTQADVEAVKAAVEFGIDDEEEKMLREEALAFKMHEAMQSGTVTMTREEVQAEYESRKATLVKFEFIEFIGMLFPLDRPGAIEQAANARQRLNAGEKFDDVLSELMRANPNAGIRSAAQNDPASERFVAFWQTAHGAEVGQILGPVILPEHEDVGVGEDGKPLARRVPAAYVVFEVLTHEPERLKTFDEAANEVATMILRRKVLEQLRAQHGVEVYPDKLPDPAGFGDQYKNSMIDTGKSAPVE